MHKHGATHNVQYVRDFVQRYERYFNNAFQILVERQMRCNMRIIEKTLGLGGKGSITGPRLCDDCHLCLYNLYHLYNRH